MPEKENKWHQAELTVCKGASPNDIKKRCKKLKIYIAILCNVYNIYTIQYVQEVFHYSDYRDNSNGSLVNFKKENDIY